jgi:hypothetical protein
VSIVFSLLMSLADDAPLPCLVLQVLAAKTYILAIAHIHYSSSDSYLTVCFVITCTQSGVSENIESTTTTECLRILPKKRPINVT